MLLNLGVSSNSTQQSGLAFLTPPLRNASIHHFQVVTTDFRIKEYFHIKEYLLPNRGYIKKINLGYLKNIYIITE